MFRTSHIAGFSLPRRGYCHFTSSSHNQQAARPVCIIRCRIHEHYLQSIIVMLTALASIAATAAELTAGPDNYLDALRVLQPGDKLGLQAGLYKDGLPIRYINGAQQAPIIISGPAAGAPAIFHARQLHNTVSIVNSSHITIRHLTFDGQGLPVDAIKAEGYSDWAHHIVLEDLILNNHGASQQTVGISSKCPAWGWIIRRNIIMGAGTGIYLGDSDGTAPFFAGLIEHNLIVDSPGYNLQIKHQNGRILQEKPVTIIRHNVFSKARNASPQPNARPNVLVGHWPSNGPGSSDHYEIYGNLFYQNPHEALFQGEGNLGLYNNIFVNDYGDAIHIQPHNDIPKAVYIFFNTILARGKGIVIKTTGEDNLFQQVARGNAIFASIPLIAEIHTHNTAGLLSDAPEFFIQPFGKLDELNLSPRRDHLSGKPLQSNELDRYENWDRDFDGYPRDTTIRGAYGTSHSTRRWQPRLELKPANKPAQGAVRNLNKTNKP